MEEKEIIGLAERYFEGNTSVEEERRLREALLRCCSNEPAIREAKAVMAYAGVTEDTLKEGSRVGKRIGWRVAASVAVVACMAALFWLIPDRGDCYTMIACVEGQSYDAAFDLIGSQLQAVGEASEEVDEDVRESLDLIFEL